VIALVRVDNRLLHGQVLETWMPGLKATEVVVADDEAALSPLARAAMTLCVPCETPARIERLAAVDFAALAASPARVLVLVRDVAALVEATRRGLTPARAPRLNLGNVHFSMGRRPVTPSVFLTAEELEALAVLASAGFTVDAQAIPTDPPYVLDELRRRYAAAR
jgi:PTS system N-acetylgalactosamine-specific IIB component